MALVLREQEVLALVGMPEALAAVERSLREQVAETAQLIPRDRAVMPRGVLHVMGGALLGEGVCGLKTYTATPGGVRFLVLLSSVETGDLLALVEADLLGRLRTGAASGVATRYLARPDAHTLGVFGTGGQAPTQIQAVCAVRPIERIYVAARNQERLRAFCTEMARLLDRPVEPATAEEAAAADVVVTITTSREPVLHGEWLRPGAHVNVAGSNWADRREVDDVAIERSAVVAVDALAQARKESGDLLIPAASGRFDWARAVELAAVAAGGSGRTAPDQITLYKSNGIALQDLALAAEVYRRARAAGAGTGLDLLP